MSAAHRDDDDFGLETIGETITKRFAASAQAAASAVAVVQGAESLTYVDLDRRSNQLARLLHRQGVRAGSVVALHAGRSIASVVAILATLKTGAAYMPLDPTAPIAYHDWILRDCGADMVLSASDRIAEFSVPTVNLEETLAAADSEPAAALEIACGPADIACIMYTSGSTGRPKGVLIPHRAVVRLVIDQTYARFGADEVFLHNAPLAFDASTFEIWGTLLHGARGVLIEDDRASLQSIVDTIQEHRVTTAWFTAGLFHALVDHQLDALKGLRQILAGGDVLSPTHVLRAQAAHPDCQLINGYGPTENTTFTCCYRIPREGWGCGPVPIGVPIRGTYVRLLDDDMKPVADGEIGMLYAGGLGLASGYLGDARHSATQFVADPLHVGARLHQTGDLARRRPDGNLDFVGRRDRQVKIDGKRVELSEIEEALRRSSGVADAVVAVLRGNAGTALLTGYVTPASSVHDRAALVSEARASLLRALPPHMRPSQVVVLDEFPLTQNGKVDQERLPACQPNEVPQARSATGETERILSGIFARALGLRAIGPDTNFFDLGATSLKLVEAHALIVRVWPSVDVLALFQHPNIRELSRAIEGRATSVQSAGQRRAQQQAAALKRMRTSRRAE
ncbi:MAG: non-ribosomal peptide synthetase [Reyranella sp.]|nr:non-ribosomal peptide synthetase [Reyranella sp.]MDP3159709.1 non-ribosomal peptide synthetase [Reyranella sp.]